MQSSSLNWHVGVIWIVSCLCSEPVKENFKKNRVYCYQLLLLIPAVPESNEVTLTGQVVCDGSTHFERCRDCQQNVSIHLLINVRQVRVGVERTVNMRSEFGILISIILLTAS